MHIVVIAARNKMDNGAVLGDEIRKEFVLESGSTFINHGSFGATPRRALDDRLRYVYAVGLRYYVVRLRHSSYAQYRTCI